jgi:hypothetical protein
MPILPDNHPLLEAVKNRRCMLFVGAGLSMMAGYPAWNTLVKSLTDEVKKQAPAPRAAMLDELTQQNDYLMLADVARTQLGKNQYAAVLQKQLNKPTKPPHAHELIATTDYRGLITTNYDRLLETVVTQVRGWAPKTFTHEAVSALATALYEPELFIFKLHGDLQSPASVVLTSQDYDQLILRSPHVRSFLQAVFLNYTILFVGYSLRDPDFQLLLRELTLIFEGYTPQHFALLADSNDLTVDHLFTRMNIRIISYNSHGGHQPVVDLLEQLQAAATWTPPV